MRWWLTAQAIPCRIKRTLPNAPNQVSAKVVNVLVTQMALRQKYGCYVASSQMKPERSEACQVNKIISFLPHTVAYLRIVAHDGECFSLTREASSRGTAEAVVPISLAI
jgi:hypothetical protein